MKVAVLISGQPRSYKWAAKNLLEVLHGTGEVSLDFYIFLWDTNGNSYTVSKYVKQSEVREELESSIRELYSPKILMIESQQTAGESWKKRLNVGTLGGEEFQAYAFYQALKSVKSLEKYDFVVWTRPDAFLGNWKDSWKIDWNYLRGVSYDVPTLWVPSNGVGTDNRIYYNDYICIGSPTLFGIFQENYEEFYLGRFKCRHKYLDLDSWRYDMGAFFMEGIFPAFINYYRLGISSDSNYVVGDLIDLRILRQCFVEAGIDPYTEQGFGFITFYHRMYLWPVSSRLVKYLYSKFLRGVSVPFFQSDEIDHPAFGNPQEVDSPELERRIKEYLVENRTLDGVRVV